MTPLEVASLPGGAKRVFRVTAQVDAGSKRVVERNVATVSAANVKGVRSDSAGVRVKALPDSPCRAGTGSLPGVQFRC